MKIKKINRKKIWTLILAMAMVLGLVPQMTIPVQAAGAVTVAPSLTATASAGSTEQSTKITVTVDNGCTLKAQVSSTEILTPNVGDLLPANAFNYASDSNLAYVDNTYKFVGIYEVDSDNKIVKFKQIELKTEEINSASVPTFTTTTNTDGTVTITEVTNQGATLEIPSAIDGKAVIAIGGGAFFNCSNITSLIIPASVKKIEDLFSFHGHTSYSALQTVSFAAGSALETIGNGAFSKCAALKTIIIPDGVKSIGNGAFGGCKMLEKITIPKSVTSIIYGAFYYCTSLESVIFAPDSSVTSIGTSAFGNCEALKEITIPDSVTSIGDGAFDSCKVLKEINFSQKLESIGYMAFSHCGNLSSVIIPASVVSIGTRAFADGIYLTSAYFYGKAPTMLGGVLGGSMVYCTPEHSSTFTRYQDDKNKWLASNIDGNSEIYNLNSSWNPSVPPATKTYTITYNANGGTGSISPQTTNVGKDTTVVTNKFTRTGYTFAGWNTKADGKGTSYTNRLPSQTAETTVTLYAQWTENSLPPVIEKLIIDLPSIGDFKEINIPEFEKIETEYNKLTNDEKLLIDETLHNKYKAIAKLVETMRKAMEKPQVIAPKPTTVPKTGDSTPLEFPITFATLGLAFMALGLYLKGKRKQQSAK